jgi:hypothetical protein
LPESHSPGTAGRRLPDDTHGDVTMFTVNTFTTSASFTRRARATSEAAPKCRAFGEAGAHNVRACVVASELLGESAKQVGPDTEVCCGKSNGCNTAAQRRCAHAYGSLHTDSPPTQSASGALLSFPSRVWASGAAPLLTSWRLCPAFPHHARRPPDAGSAHLRHDHALGLKNVTDTSPQTLARVFQLRCDYDPTGAFSTSVRPTTGSVELSTPAVTTPRNPGLASPVQGKRVVTQSTFSAVRPLLLFPSTFSVPSSFVWRAPDVFMSSLLTSCPCALSLAGVGRPNAGAKRVHERLLAPGFASSA